MEKKQNFIEVTRTAEYYSLIPADTKPVKVLFVIHGYMQLPKYFIDHFSNLPELGIAVIAPSGLSLSYQSGFDGRVGASWMTKHNREKEIKDYLAYLDQLYAEIQNTFPKCKRFELLGFSQGSATATRWFSSSKNLLDAIILSAGYVPEDVDFERLRQRLNDGTIQFYAGSKDSYLTEERVEAHKNLLNKNSIPFKITRFDGGHEIPSSALYEYFS